MKHRLLAQLCDLAYTPHKFPGIKGLKYCASFNDEKTDTQARVWMSGHVAVVVFPGTASGKDWLTNIEGYITHNRWRGIMERLNEKIYKLIPDHASIITAGHSLGAVYACYFGLHYQLEETVTFGCPNAFSSNDVEVLSNNNITRYVNLLDPVARLPRIGNWSNLGTKVHNNKINWKCQVPIVFNFLKAQHDIKFYERCIK